MTITEILASYDTDKEIYHHYGSAYEDIFSRYDRQRQLDILEIGTQKGGSLLAWKEYFPNANVTGLDVIDVVSEKYRLDTVTRIISDVKEWKTDKEFDIIIDDGSHYLGDLVFVISQFMIKLKTHGVLVIEDVRHPNLLFSVIENLMGEMKLAFPNLEHNNRVEVGVFDRRKVGNESSYLIALFKELQ